jgi:hypothetical protein
MTVGTKSILFGVHCFFIHPFVVAWAWWKLFGFPWDPRLWLCFALHDIGYAGKPNMDGPEGEEHPFVGAQIVSVICDREMSTWWTPNEPKRTAYLGKWGEFCLLHSRYLAKRYGKQPSRLAVADKLAIAIEPSWLYLPRAIASGEMEDYFEQALKAEPHKADAEIRPALEKIRWGGLVRDPWVWHEGVREYMRIWVERHKDGSADSMTSERRG